MDDARRALAAAAANHAAALADGSVDAPADADALRLKTTKSVLDRGAVLLKSAYDAQRAEQLATQPPGKAFTVAEYLAEFVAPT